MNWRIGDNLDLVGALYIKLLTKKNNHTTKKDPQLIFLQLHLEYQETQEQDEKKMPTWSLYTGLSPPCKLSRNPALCFSLPILEMFERFTNTFLHPSL